MRWPVLPMPPAGPWPPGPRPPGPEAPIGTVCLYAGNLQALSAAANTAWKCPADSDAGTPSADAVAVADATDSGVPLLTEATAWLPCDGRSVLVRAFPGLHKVLGSLYGAVDADHFNLPDLRGAFVRGVDNGAGVDPDTAERYSADGQQTRYAGVGSLQCDAFQAHQHTYDTATGAAPGEGSGAFAVKATDTTKDPTSGRHSANETRARNMALNFIIRAR
ncbi:protein rhiB [Ahniella affigens]|uniref:Protein rhiB n=1 Tax=Ahniella affigens TaxID=2021234 RepID=A0A2P1PVL3_9GAMM|nr:tail fiber protein [Ahniella affigens]AVP98891.1 protein rhiB [Ahniella affigens]